MSSFRFKQFEIHQPLSAMKVGSDGVILGAWCSLPQPSALVTQVVSQPTSQSSGLQSVSSPQVSSQPVMHPSVPSQPVLNPSALVTQVVSQPTSQSSGLQSVSSPRLSSQPVMHPSVLSQPVLNPSALGMQVASQSTSQSSISQASGPKQTTARILDVGTGTGLIAIMVAQRSPIAHIDAIEIDSDSCHDAELNFRNSPWSDRLTLHHVSLQEFVAEDRYERIISNPPYFIDSLKSPSASRNNARHTDTLPYHDLIVRSLTLLTDDGLLAVILPLAESAIFEHQAFDKGLYCCRRLEVHSTPTSGVRRVAMEFGRHPRNRELMNLTIENHARHDYSDGYKSLTKDFYLKF